MSESAMWQSQAATEGIASMEGFTGNSYTAREAAGRVLSDLIEHYPQKKIAKKGASSIPGSISSKAAPGVKKTAYSNKDVLESYWKSDRSVDDIFNN